ncbi:MAG: class I SAM-dependent methyltransferase [Alistipes sp.]|jgi:23S rRNA (cytosine1962-C5)-methyltransferase|nr:class I SAM-dependent methyltransferase [Alistipes sp.]
MNGLELIEPALADYELIDCGGGAKLERFGDRVVARPEPQALWQRSLPDEEWARMSDATFRRDGGRDGGSARGGEERGQWMRRDGAPERWTMRYDHGAMHLRMRLALTGFKHVGIFPEQAANWDFIYDTLREMSSANASSGKISESNSATENQPLRVLNLFAYTGGATLAARSAGADVTHVDSVRQTVTWARDNAELSELGDSIRWVVDDAMKFVRREVRRGSLYDGIVLDPPAYGRGPDGEKWVLAEGLDEMLTLCASLLRPHGFLVLNLYSMGLSALVARTAVHTRFGVPPREQFGELCFSDRAGKQLPLGVYYRFSR